MSFREKSFEIFQRTPFLKLLGAELLKAIDGECVIALDIKPEHLQHDGFVHAGVQATLADHSCGVAASTLMDENKMPLTAEYKINLLRPAIGQRVESRAKVLKFGRSLTIVESEVYTINNGKESLTAKATATIFAVNLDKNN